jgi:hypothetical protein
MDDEHNLTTNGHDDAAAAAEDEDFARIMRQAQMGAADGEEDLLAGLATRPLEAG